MKNQILVAALALMAGACSLVKIGRTTTTTQSQAEQMVLTSPASFNRVGEKWLKLNPCQIGYLGTTTTSDTTIDTLPPEQEPGPANFQASTAADGQSIISSAQFAPRTILRTIHDTTRIVKVDSMALRLAWDTIDDLRVANATAQGRADATTWWLELVGVSQIISSIAIVVLLYLTLTRKPTTPTKSQVQ